jgi:hypothetical protein
MLSPCYLFLQIHFCIFKNSVSNHLPNPDEQSVKSTGKMNQIFGDFIEDLPLSQEYLIIGFSPSSIPLKQRWRNNGLSADFLADYLITFFPLSDPENETNQQAEIKSAVNYIANELLENAMKFNDESCQYPISIQLHLKTDRIIFAVTNSISKSSVINFQDFIEKLLTSDSGQLYIDQLEKNATDEANHVSRLGYLTMLNDYTAKLGWKFQTVPQQPDIMTVTTMVQLPVQSID